MSALTVGAGLLAIPVAAPLATEVLITSAPFSAAPLFSNNQRNDLASLTYINGQPAALPLNTAQADPFFLLGAVTEPRAKRLPLPVTSLAPVDVPFGQSNVTAKPVRHLGHARVMIGPSSMLEETFLANHSVHHPAKTKPAAPVSSLRLNKKLVVNKSATTSAPLLGSSGTLTSLTPVSKRWNRVEAAAMATIQNAAKCADQGCLSAALKPWNALIAETSSMREGRRIAHVNKQINRMIAYKEDIQVWRKAEYWASPKETLVKGAGDCEDYAILKYWTLKQLGFADQDLRIVVLRDSAARAYHAVLAVAYNDDWLILDNRFSRVRFSRDLPNYQPLYSLNAENQWAHVATQNTPVRLASRLNLDN
ncbi:MAG: transglutaminase-like cysteine peptidase [Rhodobacteraceae bacterium]|nr:transglutaminase-like cysteine peptidase [Paracoccaceae bacterium]